MISLTPIIKLLTPEPPDFLGPWFRSIGSGGSFAQMRADQLPLPAAWIVRSADKSRHAGERAEDVALGFDVVIAIENAREHYPGESDDILLLYRKAVFKLLLEYTIADDIKPLNFDGGQVIEYTEADIYWRDRYTFAALITNYLPDPSAYAGLQFTGELL